MTRRNAQITRLAVALWVLGIGGGVLVAAPFDRADVSVAELEKQYDAAAKAQGSKAAFDEYREKFDAVAQSQAGTEEGLLAELWLLRMRWWERSAGTMEKNAGPHARRLIEAYPKSPLLHRIPEFDYLYSLKDLREIGERLRELSPHRKVHAKTHFALAKRLRRSDAEASKKELEILIRDYKDLVYRATTYGEIANAYLHPHDPAKLEIGQPAPEIVGTDVHGQAMRLSDYKGKVILLDFWGDW